MLDSMGITHSELDQYFMYVCHLAFANKIIFDIETPTSNFNSKSVVNWVNLKTMVLSLTTLKSINI